MATFRNVTATVTRKIFSIESLENSGLESMEDWLSDKLWYPLKLEPVSSVPVNQSGGFNEKEVERNCDINDKKDEVKYSTVLQLEQNFGKLGAILVTNNHHKEMFLKDIVLEGLQDGDVRVICDSWVYSKNDNPEKRIFFINQAYLPSQTPHGLIDYRNHELCLLRGNDTGERQAYDRIYDYDVYNDLGDPDKNKELHRPVLGSKQYPYPRRCRTGRPPTKKEPWAEKRSSTFYVPRDEEFSNSKEITFSINALDNVLHALVPSLEASIIDKNLKFESFKEILELFNTGMELSNLEGKDIIALQLPHWFQTEENTIFKFPATDLMDRDEFAWFKDEEFARETLAGLNPCVIKLVTEWPLQSKLEHLKVSYGDPNSVITQKIIEHEIKGVMTFKEALDKKKLFILDYDDILLPFVNKVREIEGTTLYGSRTLFFLTPEGTLRPIAIELTRPPTEAGMSQWKKVFTPTCSGATEAWLWTFAKAHVLAHDSGVHQLISHWLRTHCCVEPYIIATHRQLSAMHPIYKLMKPYFRFTMMMNALARKSLINAGGIIESTFSAEKYCMELSSVIYDQLWRFDQQGLPADLITRGMAIEDETARHGLKLTIEDYPFANDGLILWDAIKSWVTDYVIVFYTDENPVESEKEIQAWWKEIRTKGHPEKKDEKWWPKLETRKDLIDILTSMIWVTSGQHAAVNFGQYAYGAYFPNRPTIARKNMPSEDPTNEEWKMFLQNPVSVLLETFPSKLQATKVMAVLGVLSSHSPDEEYIGDQIEPSWDEDDRIKNAFKRFQEKLHNMDSEIDSRNINVELKNRYGSGILPYQLLKPFSDPGVTAMGVPNSISI